MAVNRDIKYINKDFSELRSSLITFAKTYFPTTYNDFSPSSPGMMFMEMAAYVGDILSFYTDNQIQENFLQYARQTNNLYDLAYMFGYKPKVTGVASVNVNFYQQVPAIISGSTYAPDFSYALLIGENSTVISSLTGSTNFLVSDKVDFSYSSSADPTTVSIYTLAAGVPTYYLLKKTRNAVSATIKSTSFSFNEPVEFSTVTINDDKIIGILDITDSDGNIWYEVDYLAQDTIYDSISNTNTNDPNNSVNSSDTPYLLQLKQIQRRFTTRFLSSGSLQLQFGSGISSDTDEIIIPNPDNVGLGLPFEKSKLTTAYSPTNFIFNNTYGIAPSNTTLTVRYLTGGGVESNVPAGALTIFNSPSTKFLNYNLNPSVANIIFGTLRVNNEEAATGGQDGDSIEEIRKNASANFATQLRNVTADDYLVRALSMPPNYGTISKAYITKPTVRQTSTGEIGSLDLYVLSYDNLKRLRAPSTALKNNLKTYLSQYRMVGDSINIKNAFIVNIGVDFDIIVLPNFNNNEVLLACITALKQYFNINNWQINQPIILRDIYILLDRIQGVQTVKNINITNKVGLSEGYSNYIYDISGATQNNVIYPSIDPMIFECRYPDTDIQGRVVPL